MWPDLFRIPVIGIPIHTYGVMIVIGFLAAVFVITRLFRRLGHYENDFMDFAFWALVGGITGARIVFVLVEWKQYFIEQPFTEIGSTGIKIPSIFALWQGGLVFWGSFLGGFVAFLIFAHKRKIPLLPFADYVIVGLPLAQMFGRLGCIGAGCCWGRSEYHWDAAGKLIQDVPFALQFPPNSSAYSSLIQSSSQQVREWMMHTGHTVPLFPSQLFESFGAIIIFFILLWMVPRKWFHGQLLLSYVMLYSIMRSILEFFRGDVERGYVIDGVLSTSQFISIIAVIVTLITFVVLRAKKR